jgi:hypothetical protein
MSSDRVHWCKKQRQYIPNKPRLSPDGLPIDARDWTEEDWRDLHVAIERIKARVAARHKAKP